MMRYRTKVQFLISKLHRRVRAGKNRALYRTAGLIRATARNNVLRVRKGTATPGKPPHSHTRGGLRVIQFHVSNDKAIIGPLKFPRSSDWNEPVTHIHEFGGVFFRRYKKTSTIRRAIYPERSFMGTTLKRLMDKDKIPKQFRVSIAELL